MYCTLIFVSISNIFYFILRDMSNANICVVSRLNKEKTVLNVFINLLLPLLYVGII